MFIDGQLRLDRPGLRPGQGPVKLEVEIGPTDRFLTLAATVGVKEQGCHWLVLGDPVLKMTSTESENKDRATVQLPPQHNDPGQPARKEKPMNGP